MTAIPGKRQEKNLHMKIWQYLFMLLAYLFSRNWI